MKKLALALCLLAVSFTAQAQFEKGTTIINPSLSGLDFSYSNVFNCFLNDSLYSPAPPRQPPVR